MSDEPEHQDASHPRLVYRGRRRAGGPHVDDLVAAYTLGALEPDERAQVERHSRGCARCARLIAADRDAVALLGLLAPPATPPPEARAALLARVARAQAEARSATAPAGAPARVRPTVGLPSSRPVVDRPPATGAMGEGPSAPPRRWRLPGGVTRFASLPLVLALVLGAGWALEWRSPTDDGPDQVRNAEVRRGGDGTLGGMNTGTAGRAADALTDWADGAVDLVGIGRPADPAASDGNVELLSPGFALHQILERSTDADVDLGTGLVPSPLGGDGGLDLGGGPASGL